MWKDINSEEIIACEWFLIEYLRIKEIFRTLYELNIMPGYLENIDILFVYKYI